MFPWHDAHTMAFGAAAACGSWQLVHAACAPARVDASVCMPTWHDVHVAFPARNSCGAWQVAHAACPPGFGPASRAWQLAHVAPAARAGVCAAWQSTHAAVGSAEAAGARTRAAWCCVRSSWQPSHGLGLLSLLPPWAT
jgi:hypothetical protein